MDKKKREEFLKTAASMVTFAQALQKLKTCDKTVTLTKEEANSIIMGLQLLREGEKTGG